MMSYDPSDEGDVEESDEILDDGDEEGVEEEEESE